MSSAIVSEARRTVAQRSIRVLVSPTPVTFAERRAVLQVLEQIGPIDHFKMVQGYCSNFMSLTRHTHTADKLINKSPISYQISVMRSDGQVDGTNGKFATSMTQIEIRNSSYDDPGVDLSPSQDEPLSVQDPEIASRAKKSFTLNIWPAEDYVHEHASRGSPLHQPWPQTYKNDRSYIAESLKQSLPRTIAREGLAHWLLEPGKQATPLRQRLNMKKWIPKDVLKARFDVEKVASDEAPNTPAADLETTPRQPD